MRDIVQFAASGDWSIPEFQREFEWKYEQVTTLCNSLYSDLPVGLLTIWNTTKYNEPQSRPVSGRVPYWIVDGQQRITSFCILLGHKPNWMNNDQWIDHFGKNRIYLNVDQDGGATIGRLSRKSRMTVPLDEIIHRAPAEAQRYVQLKCAEAGIQNSEKGSDLAVNALSILDRVIPVAEVGDEKGVEDIAELYRRLNSQGTKLRQAQIMLAFVSQYNPGWVRQEFYPFLEDLSNRDDWELDPAHVLQVATIVAEGKARVGEATDAMWQSLIQVVWSGLKGAIEEAILHLWERGITDQAMVPSSYTLIPLFAILTKFANKPNYDFEKVFKWFVLANLSGRYSDSPLETLSRDAGEIFKAASFDDVMQRLAISLSAEDLRNLVSQKFRDNSSQALLLHLLLWSAQAEDWIEHHDLPALTRAPRNLEPQWHHIVPKAWARRNGYEDYDKTANVTRLCAKTNVRALSSTPPWQYVPTKSIPAKALREHLVAKEYADKFTRGQPLNPDQFKDFLSKRGEAIVQQAASLLGIEYTKEAKD
jgi:hypothetical protein